jgi:hypothetical protein
VRKCGVSEAPGEISAPFGRPFCENSSTFTRDNCTVWLLCSRLLLGDRPAAGAWPWRDGVSRAGGMGPGRSMPAAIGGRRLQLGPDTITRDELHLQSGSWAHLRANMRVHACARGLLLVRCAVQCSVLGTFLLFGDSD